MNGQVFTIEALIAMLVLASSFILISALKQETSPVLYDYVLVSDAFEVVEKQYHLGLADSCRNGVLSSEIANLIGFAANQTERQMFISCDKLDIPHDCEPYLKIVRMTTYNESNEIVWRRVNIGICR
jgi:hypothetical protein